MMIPGRWPFAFAAAGLTLGACIIHNPAPAGSAGGVASPSAPEGPPLREFTEVDVPVGEIPGPIEEKLQRQSAITHDIVGACMAVDKCSGITFWGVADPDSWLNDPHWGRLRGKGPRYPLLFNARLEPKAVVGGVVALNGR